MKKHLKNSNEILFAITDSISGYFRLFEEYEEAKKCFYDKNNFDLKDDYNFSLNAIFVDEYGEINWQTAKPILNGEVIDGCIIFNQ